MSAALEAKAALPLIWQTMVVLAEENNDSVVNEQLNAAATAANNIAESASDLVALARAAQVLARLCQL